MPQLERLILHRLAELDGQVRGAYEDFDFKRIVAALSEFMIGRPLGALFRHPQGRALLRPTASRAPAACLHGDGPAVRAPDLARADAAFTAEEAWLARHGATAASVHLELFPDVPAAWRDDAEAERWAQGRAACAAWSPARWRSSGATSASARRWRPRPSSISPIRSCSPPSVGVDLAEVSHHSAATLVRRRGAGRRRSGSTRCRASRSSRGRAQGRKCARSWKILTTVGDDPHYPDVSPRDAKALREWDALRKAAE